MLVGKKEYLNKYNRAKEKRNFQKQIDEALLDNYVFDEYIDEKGVEDNMSRIVEPRKLLLVGLRNAIKGHAQSVLNSTTLTPEEKQEDFDIIEEFLQYIDNYYENQSKLADYDRMKLEYERWKKDIVNDGR